MTDDEALVEEALKGLETYEGSGDPTDRAWARMLPIENHRHRIRIYNGLRNAGIKSVDELRRWSRDDLMDVKNLGRLTVRSIEQALHALGLKLAPSPHTPSPLDKLAAAKRRECVICLDPRTTTTFCGACGDAYDRWQRSPENVGDTESLIVFVARRTRRTMASTWFRGRR